MPTTAILGGGLSGLTAAYYLSKALPREQIILIERAARLGGWIETTHDAQSGVSFETGPRSIRPAGLAGLLTLELIRDLGLAGELQTVAKDHPAARNRFIYHNGKLNRAPNSVLSALSASLTPSSPFRGLVGSLLTEPFRHRRRDRGDESVDSFVARRLGKNLANNVVSALVHGIYAGDTRQLSLRAVFPSLWKLEKNGGGILRGMLTGAARSSHEETQAIEQLQRRLGPLATQMKRTSVYSLKHGLGTLVSALADSLARNSNVVIQPSTSVNQMAYSAGSFQLQTSEGAIEASHLISSITPSALFHLARIPELRANPSVTVAVVNLAFEKPFSLPVQGFGYLLPRTVAHEDNPHQALGVVFDSDMFPNAQGRVVVTVMMGGHYWDGQSAPDPEALTSGALNTLRLHGIAPADTEPLATQVRIQRNCIPQYQVGHVDRMRSLHSTLLDTYNGKLSVVGAGYRGVGVNDCIRSSWEVAKRLGAGSESTTGLEHFEDDC